MAQETQSILTRPFPVNIFSHLIGSVLFLTLPFVAYKEVHPRHEIASTAEIVVFATFFLGVAICFALSVAYVCQPFTHIH
jgi:adiponectin receptor